MGTVANAVVIMLFMMMLLVVYGVFIDIVNVVNCRIDVATVDVVLSVITSVVVVSSSVVVAFFANKRFRISLGRKLPETPTHRHPRCHKDPLKHASKTFNVYKIPGILLLTYREVYSQTGPVCFCAQTHAVRCPGKVLLTASSFSDGFCLANKTPRNL